MKHHMSLRAHRAGAVRVEPGVRQFVVHGPDGYSLRTQVWVDGAILDNDPTSRSGRGTLPSGRWLL